jgi:hypothetical protein
MSTPSGSWITVEQAAAFLSLPAPEATRSHGRPSRSDVRAKRPTHPADGGDDGAELTVVLYPSDKSSEDVALPEGPSVERVPRAMGLQ